MSTETTPTVSTHVIPKGQPVAAVVGGVVAWRVAKGAAVAKYDLIAIVDDVEITAAYSGRVSALMVAEGGTVVKGATIAYIDDGKPVASQKPLQAAAAVSGPNRRAAPEQPQPTRPVQAAEPVAQPPQEPRTRRNAHVEALVIEDLTPPQRKPPKKRKMVNRTYSVAPDDEEEITQLAAFLGKIPNAPDGVNESLLVRVAISRLLKSISETGDTKAPVGDKLKARDEAIRALVGDIQDRIDIERKAGVGAGRRRKPKAGVL